MRKLLLFAILALVVVACNKDYTGTDAGYGSLKISAVIDRSVISIQSRAVNINPETYFLTIQSDQGIVYDDVFPVGGKISNLPAGTYTGELKSDAAGFTVPEFDSPFYVATVNNIVVTSGGTTSVDFVCKQLNSGVRFIYDSSLAAAGYGNIVPVVTQSGQSLNYSGANKNTTGYFASGNAILKLLDGGVPVAIYGSSTEIPLTFEPKELWTITLKAVVSPDSKSIADITAKVETDVIDRVLDVTIGAKITTIVFQENFAKCAGPDYPIEGATFSSSGFTNSLATEKAISDAGLTGWTFVSGYTCKNGLKMGIANGNGIATTPPLDKLSTTPKDVTLTFMAANWETASRSLKIEVTGAGSVASPVGGTISLPAGTSTGVTISAASAMQQYTVLINGATEDTRIVFSPSSATGNNRYFLSDVTVFFEE